MALTITITPKAVLGILAILGIIILNVWLWMVPDEEFERLFFGDGEDGR